MRAPVMSSETENTFLRRPGPDEGDIVFAVQDLREYHDAIHVWGGA